MLEYYLQSLEICRKSMEDPNASPVLEFNFDLTQENDLDEDQIKFVKAIIKNINDENEILRIIRLFKKSNERIDILSNSRYAVIYKFSESSDEIFSIIVIDLLSKAIESERYVRYVATKKIMYYFNRKVDVSNFIKSNHINMCIGGQFGSEGKGLMNQFISAHNNIDIVTCSMSPNSGHTFYTRDDTHFVKQNSEHKYIARMLPVTAIVNKKCLIYYSANSVIDISILFDEIYQFGIQKERVCIHPNAAITSKLDRDYEKRHIASAHTTSSGTGRTRSTKYIRKAVVAKDENKLQRYIVRKDFLQEQLYHYNVKVFHETGQGVGLGLNHGYEYPYCTSNDVLPSNILADLGLHPKYLGNVALVMRAHPIRSGNVGDETSGPFYPDSKEISWSDLSCDIEITSVTKKERRIATWSKEQYKEVVGKVRPNLTLITHLDYLDDTERQKFLISLPEIPSWISQGPWITDIRSIYKDKGAENGN